jgi:hypothetical protein
MTLVLNGSCPKDPIFILEAHCGTQLEWFDVTETPKGTRRKVFSKIYYKLRFPMVFLRVMTIKIKI